jgi:septal ring factor EnvC (AmiA/AmiB activator)
MEIEDNSPIIQSTVDTPVLRRSSRRKLVLSEEFVPSSEMVEPSDKLSKFKASPLEKEALEAIVQLRDSPPEPTSEAEQGPKEDWDKLFKETDNQLREVQEKNHKLHQENITLGRQLTSQVNELAEECNQLKKNIIRKRVQKKQLANIYKQNLILREENRRLTENLYLAKNMLSKKNLAIFLKEISPASSPKLDD